MQAFQVPPWKTAVYRCNPCLLLGGSRLLRDGERTYSGIGHTAPGNWPRTSQNTNKERVWSHLYEPQLLAQRSATSVQENTSISEHQNILLIDLKSSHLYELRLFAQCLKLRGVAAALLRLRAQTEEGRSQRREVQLAAGGWVQGKGCRCPAPSACRGQSKQLEAPSPQHGACLHKRPPREHQQISLNAAPGSALVQQVQSSIAAYRQSLKFS